jgi:short-subunit dehydrogenase
LVTGASSGIGEAFVDDLAAAGVDLIIVGRSADALQEVAIRNRERGVDVDIICADLSEEEGVAQVIDAIRNAEPMIDLLVNNAGIGRGGAFVDLSPLHLHETMRVNNDALIRLTHAALPRMVEADHGCVILLSSSAASGPVPNHAVYVASKAFVSNFGQALSQELADTNVTCTTVLTGMTRTNYFERNAMEHDVAESRFASAEQVAQQALRGARECRTLVYTGSSHPWLLQMSNRFPLLTNSYAVRQLKNLRIRLIEQRAKQPS